MITIKLLATVTLMSITYNAMAQDDKTDKRENFRFGIKAGLNYSNIFNSSSEELSTNAKFGFAGGAVIRIPITKYLGIQPEILFSQKGFKANGTILGWEYTFSRTSSYIDFPIQIALKPSELITFVAGPQYSYLLSQKDVFTSTIFSNSEEQVFETKNIRKNILGLVAGLDVNIMHFVLGARMGLDIMKNQGDGTSSTPQYKNAWVQGTIGYMF